MAEALALAGYRVVVVEQTETPDGLAKRNAELKAKVGREGGVGRKMGGRVEGFAKSTLT